ncbi:MAG: AMP-dependent synthetase/ligase [Gammaproteobacteria bacterium]|nr:AMP-dependent synthetase/ligase [Gammaproteobacteria bacterium]MCW8974030.1 AMP-dependent synthetase/ligase [Gammaproteobacteria bacterium]MCW8993681.1 AMP-dependent synthetase/ligase [Gammaproteobacteria bacterium]
MSTSRADLIPLEEAHTLDGLFRTRVRYSPDKIAYSHYDRERSAWHEFSWREMATEVARWQAGLRSLGLQAGERVAMSLRNCPQWVMFEQAATGLGLVVIPLYTDDRPDNIAFIVEDAGVKLLLVQDIARWKRLAPSFSEQPSLKSVVILNGECEDLTEEDERLVCSGNLLPEGEFPLLAVPRDPHALATIVYTSGTTGRPKGVMLSHYNILSLAAAALSMVELGSEEVFLSFLPLAHTLERTGGYYLPMMAGATVTYSRSIQQLAEDLQIIRPTALISVPRIYERVYNRITTQLVRGPALRRWLFRAAVAVGWHHFERQQGRRHWHPKLLLHPLLHRLVADKVMARLGGRLDLAISGGAALPPEVARVFIGLGLNLLQGYGLTETSPVISVNVPEDNDPASVGIPLPGVQVRIGADHELQVKSPGIMLGYWNNHKATAEMIGSDGWLNTGDQAAIRNGHIYITGRLKDILVLSNGEKIPPAEMEMAIALDPLFEQVMVIGEGCPYLAALIVLDAEQWPEFAAECGVEPVDAASLQDKQVIATVINRINGLLHNFPRYARIRRVHLSQEPWGIDNGLLTPTMKIKRNKVLEHLNKQVAALYRTE